MKVTKNIKEYIEKEVSTRLASKYEADKQTAEYENRIENEVWEEVLTAMQKAYDEVMAKACAEYGFLENLHDETRGRCVEITKFRAFTIQGKNNATSVHRWASRMREEAATITKDIIVTLELGGTKAELMEMLEKIG